ncbi:cytochrome c [soil metagenome]
MENESSIYVFIDDELNPIAELRSPVNFELDTRKIVDGKHSLKIISKDPTGKEGIRLIPFEVKNGPAISIEGLKENAVVDGVLPIMINAYGKGNQTKFLITGSETPKGIPSWLWLLFIVVGVSMLFYFISYISIEK